MNAPSESSGPLAGVTVVELAGLGPVLHGVTLLADLGADVVRVDRPAAVPAERPTASPREPLGRGRRSVALDLKADAGRELFERLLDDADVLVDPYRPGVLERLGLDPERLTAERPRLVVARMTGWGQSGPLAASAGHDLNYLARTGALQLIGEEDRPPPVPLNLIGDFGGGGMLLAFGVAAALFERERSGRGQVIDVAMIDGIASLMTSIFQLDARAKWKPGRHTNWLQGAAPWYSAYETADGRFVTVATLEPQFYAALLGALGMDLEEWPQWDEDGWPRLRERLAATFRTATMAEWEERLADVDCCFAPVLWPTEAAADGHLAERGVYREIEGVLQPGAVPRFSRSPAAPAPPAPWPGADTRAVLADLGVDGARLEELAGRGVLAGGER